MDISKFKDIIKSEKLSIFVFSAEWCTPCHEIWETLTELVSNVKNEINIHLLDIDEYPEIAEKLGIIGVPSLYIFKNSNQKYSSLGVLSKLELENLVNKYVHSSQEIPVR